MHLTLEGVKELGFGDLVDLQGAVFGQDRAQAELARVDVGVMIANELFKLAGALRRAGNGRRRPAEEVADLMGEASVNASRERAGSFTSSKLFLRWPYPRWVQSGPPTTIGGGGRTPSSLTNAAPSRAAGPSTMRWSLRDGVYWVGPVYLADALEGMGGASRNSCSGISGERRLGAWGRSPSIGMD